MTLLVSPLALPTSICLHICLVDYTAMDEKTKKKVAKPRQTVHTRGFSKADVRWRKLSSIQNNAKKNALIKLDSSASVVRE